MTSPYRILVTASRDWTDEARLRSELDKAAAGAGDRRIVIVHGDCPDGGDRMADRWARDHGAVPEAHPAQWNRLGNAAGPVRNSFMAARGAAVCLAFLMPCRKHASLPPHDSHGAADCAGKAEAAGIPVRRFRLHPGVLEP